MIVNVRRGEAAILERLGRFQAVLREGRHYYVPLVDKVRARVDLKKRTVAFHPQRVETADHGVLTVAAKVTFQVSDPKSAVYQVGNYSYGVEQLTATAVRAALDRMSLEEAVMSGDPLESEVLGVLQEAAGRWGIRTTRVELRMTPVHPGENNDNTE